MEVKCYQQDIIMYKYNFFPKLVPPDENWLIKTGIYWWNEKMSRIAKIMNYFDLELSEAWEVLILFPQF